MKEILSKLLASDVLSEETKTDVTKMMETYVTTLTESIRQETRIEMTRKFVQAQDQLIEAIDKKLGDAVTIEIAELKSDLVAQRDLEVEYAERLVEEKQHIAEQLATDIDSLVDRVDEFLNERLESEIRELREDITDVQRLQFGKKIFESFEAEFIQHRDSDTAKLEKRLAEATDRANDLQKRLRDAEQAALKEARQEHMAALLENVDGLAREQLKILLSNVPTERLDEAYKTYAPRVLKEALAKLETTVIKESMDAQPTIMITGNERLNEEKTDTSVQDSEFARLRRLAGIV